MTYGPPNTQDNFLPESISISDIYLKTVLENISRNVNRKETASYQQIEQLNNQEYFGATPQIKRFVFRKVFPFGAVATGATLNIAHGIVGLTEFTRIYGTCITNVVDYRPIPFSSVGAANQGTQVLIAGINIVITNGAAAPNITSGIIILEYLKQ